MAGTPLAAPSQSDHSSAGATCPVPTFLSDSWRRAKPFAHLSASARLDYLHEYGMHGGEGVGRVGADAFELRGDIEIGDACETVAQLLKALVGSLDVLTMVSATSSSERDALAACAFLAKQAAGALAVMAAGVFPGCSDQPASNDEWSSGPSAQTS